MDQTDTILLAIPDTARRAACFTALAISGNRIVRGFANPAEVVEALVTIPSACVVIDRPGFSDHDFAVMIEALGSHPAASGLIVAPALTTADALALLDCQPCDVLMGEAEAPAIADRVETLLPLVRALNQRAKAERTARVALARLSPREQNVLAGLAAGQTSKDIARQLGVSPRTVEVHRASIMRRTNAATLADLLRLHFLIEYAAPSGMARAA